MLPSDLLPPAGQPTTVHREDYSAPAYWIDTVELTFDLEPAKTRVLNKMRLRRNPDMPGQALHLSGDELNLARVLVNGAATPFKLEGTDLVLQSLPEGNAPIDLEIFTTCAPDKNTQLMGLYSSRGSLFTQCEAEGFRRITYFLDRPDVMALFTVTLRANKAQFPVLLSNGNLVEQGDLPDGRHFATWVDPHKKPCYLFALVAGQFVLREQKIKSRAGTEHLLQIFVRPGDLDKTEHAMNSLMASIAWDEARFGLPLDLERFMIVATSDFNMGAMENKGLNIFNTKYVLASQATATDADYAGIESVIGHEYFHNWTGNRVTCRDWFQLSLKEGLTVFRDQEFSMDMAASPSARAVKRIDDVRVLRTVQFPEDAGPMAHPVRPDSYIEINNFYTVTVYEKGAEVVRMQHTLVGREGFAKGMQLYFERHDGQAVTCDDFAQAIADANPESPLAQHLPQFKRWLSQSGTPRLAVHSLYDALAHSYTLSFSQTCPASAGQPNKTPFVIPITLGLIGADGSALPIRIRADERLRTIANSPTEHTVVLTEPTHTVVFEEVSQPPTPSLLRNFSAPVILDMDYSDDALLHLLAHDSDAFNRWEASQRLGLRIAIKNIASKANSVSANDLFEPNILPPSYIHAMRSLLRDPQLDAAFKDLALTLPSEAYITEQLDSVEPLTVHQVRQAMRQQLATELASDWAWAYAQNSNTGAYRPDAESAGKRALAGHALLMLCIAAQRSGDPVWPGKALQRCKDASNMTDRYNALSALVASASPLAALALQHFHALFKQNDLVIDKWFALQASAPDVQGSALAGVRQLMKRPDFNIQNPNRARSVIFSYCNGNPAGFHRADGAGYAFWAEQVMALDAFNPQIAARLARALERWKKLAEPYRSAAGQAIAKVAAHPKLSRDVQEIVSQALNH